MRILKSTSLHVFILLAMMISLHLPCANSQESTPIGGQPLDLNDSEYQANWQARWIQNPVFRNLPYRHLLRQEKEEDRSGRSDDDPKNIHTLFRKTFELGDSKPQSARLYITADDVYKLYVNGVFVGLGPAPAYLFAYPYNGWDVAEFLRPGETNCIAVHVYYQGLPNRVWGSGDNLQGLLAQLELKGGDGKTEIIGTDESWKYLQTDAYKGTETIGYKTQFVENIDMREKIDGWKDAGFDDSSWEVPHVAGNPVPELYTLVPQLTPPLAFEKVYPQKIVKTETGRYFIDFGSELTGSTCLTVSGPEGHVVEIRHAEELSAPNEARFKMRACTYQEFCTLSGKPNETIEFFDYKGFRYVEVLNWPDELTLEKVWVLNRHYPYNAEASSFHSSNELLNRIWELCANGAKQGTQDTYLDCPTREKGGYLGDAYVTGQTHLYLTGDPKIFRKALQDFADSARICPGLMAVAPGNLMQEIADYSLLWPILLERYYMWTGDLQFIQEKQPILDGLLAYFARYENADGLLENVDEKWNLVDWPDNLRDGYDYDRAAKGVNTVLNGFYHGCIESAVHLCAFAGRPAEAAKLRQKVDRLEQSMNQKLLDRNTGLFIDAQGSQHSALHANALPLMFGIEPSGGITPLVELLKKKRMECGVYFSSFVLEGLYNAGQPELAYDLLASKDIHSWYTMLEAGATTCMEAWGPEQKWNTSWCHPWSSCPVFITASELMGLKPGTPGWKSVAFEPAIPASLESAELAITIPQGKLSSSFTREGKSIVFRLNIPQGTSATVAISGIQAKAIADGKECICSPVTDDFGVERMQVPSKLGAGGHTIQVTME